MYSLFGILLHLFHILIHNKYKTELTEILYNWIKFHEIAVVLDYNIDVFYKKQLKFFLQSKCGASSVNFYTFKNFKAHKDGLVFLNSILIKRVWIYCPTPSRTMIKH